MWRGLQVLVGIGAIALATLSVMAQATGAKKPSGALGDLVSIDVSAGVLTIKVSAAANARATVSPTTEYLLIEPGKTNLEAAEKITLADVKVGDRVWARGETTADGTVSARQIVVMSASAIAERNQRDAADWQARGVIGEVKSVDAATGGLTVETYRGESIGVSTTPATTLRHLKPGATDLGSSEPIAFSDIRTGNQIAMRGDRSPDRTQLAAETILTGDFPKPLRGRVTAVDAKQRVATITVPGGSSVVLSIPDTALVRKLAPAAPKSATTPTADERRGPRGFAFALGDREELERRTTTLTLGDIKPGDFVFAIVETGAQTAQPRVRIVVKFEIPADRTPRQQGAPSIGDAGMGDLPF